MVLFQDPRVLYTFVSNKPFGQLLVIYPKKTLFLKTFNSDFSEQKIGLKYMITLVEGITPIVKLILPF